MRKFLIGLGTLSVLLALAVGGATTAGAGGDDDDRGDDGFKLGGTAKHAQDPENSANDVIKIDTTSPDATCNPSVVDGCNSGTVSRKLNARIHKLDNMVELKAYFQNRGCGGGSPRVQLAIDLNGDGQSDGNAHGNFGPAPFGGGCPPQGVWDYQDLTDTAPRWDVTQLTGPGEIVLPGGQNPFLVPWDLLEQLVSGFADHRVCTGALVDDSGWSPGAEGVAFYDIISLGRGTWEDRDDTAGRGFAGRCGRPDKDDDDHDDGDRDDDDDDDDRGDRDDDDDDDDDDGRGRDHDDDDDDE
jgi:hypothetical protein